MKVDTFEDFLKKRKEEKDLGIDWEQQEQQWIKSVTGLYNEIEKWLNPFQKEGLLIIKEDSWANINEDGFGKYDLKKLDIIIGKRDIITLTPRGKLLVGGYGRIDMRGPKGEISIIQKGKKWKFKNMVSLIEFEDVNSESFEAVIQDLVNG